MVDWRDRVSAESPHRHVRDSEFPTRAGDSRKTGLRIVLVSGIIVLVSGIVIGDGIAVETTTAGIDRGLSMAMGIRGWAIRIPT